MASIEHSQRAHALLSASGASRWINCTPSARLEEQYGGTVVSAYAKEGTLAHEIAELMIRYDVEQQMSEEAFQQALADFMNDELFKDEMLEVLPTYTDYCIETYNTAFAKSNFSKIDLERKLDLSKYVPNSFGTADCIIINDQDNTLEVIDLKYGKGVPVSAEWNKQLMLYGLGALEEYALYFDVEKVILTIVQPRLDNISSFVISREDLENWAEEELVPAARAAYEGTGDLQPGEWCKFCRVHNRCRALADEQLKIAKHDFSDPRLLSDEEIADIVTRSKSFITWVDSVSDYALSKAVQESKEWPGLKLVHGTARRAWKDPESVVDCLLGKYPELSEDQLQEIKPKSLTAIEALIGKKRFGEECKDLVVKPEGKPTLVSIDDKRPAIGGCQDAINDFK